MKKNLKKLTALTLAAIAAASMSTAAFAANPGDVDGNGMYTANDAAMIYYTALLPEKAAEKYGEKAAQNVKENGAVRYLSLVSGTLDLGDASFVLDKVNKGGDLKDKTKEGFMAVYDVAAASKGTEVNHMTVADDGITIKIGTDSFKYPADKDKAFDEFYDELVLKNEREAGVSFGNINITIPVEDENAKVTDIINDALKLDVNKNTINSKKDKVVEQANKFEINGYSLGSDEGWTKLGEKIAGSSPEAKAAFAKLSPENFKNNTDDYIKDLVDNVKAAFPAEDKEAVMEKIKNTPVETSRQGRLIMTFNDGTAPVDTTDPKKGMEYAAEYVLYADKDVQYFDYRVEHVEVYVDDLTTPKFVFDKQK